MLINSNSYNNFYLHIPFCFLNNNSTLLSHLYANYDHYRNNNLNFQILHMNKLSLSAQIVKVIFS